MFTICFAVPIVYRPSFLSTRSIAYICQKFRKRLIFRSTLIDKISRERVKRKRKTTTTNMMTWWVTVLSYFLTRLKRTVQFFVSLFFFHFFFMLEFIFVMHATPQHSTGHSVVVHKNWESRIVWFVKITNYITIDRSIWILCEGAKASHKIHSCDEITFS